jgi:hypothetical protein
MTFDDWYAIGAEHGWVIGAFCAAHDGSPYTEAEADAAAEAGVDLFDVCAPCVRISVDGLLGGGHGGP